MEIKVVSFFVSSAVLYHIKKFLLLFKYEFILLLLYFHGIARRLINMLNVFNVANDQNGWFVRTPWLRG